MMKKRTVFFFISLICYQFADGGDFRERIFNAPCGPDYFRCLNDACIRRDFYCNNIDDCGDNSDELYCAGTSHACPTHYPFYQCKLYYSKKCIPAAWRCDGTRDCGDGVDEKNCEILKTLSPRQVQHAKLRAVRWMIRQASNRAADKWGSYARKASVALYLSGIEFINNTITRRELSYELSIQLLSRLSLQKLKDISTPDLSSFINALQVTCLDPRKFHSFDLVKELRARVDIQNFTLPYDLLTLCNAGETMMERDIKKLTHLFRTDHREVWTETQAIAVMALACAGHQPESHFSLTQLHDFNLVLKQKQSSNGSVENLQTLALVMQALFSSEYEDDENNFDESKALQQILRGQEGDGSFGNFINTYYVLPVLNYKSLVNISSNYCEMYQKDVDWRLVPLLYYLYAEKPRHKRSMDGSDAVDLDILLTFVKQNKEKTELEDLVHLSGRKIRIRYSIWIGDERNVEQTIRLKVAENTSFYGVMEMAGDIDQKFRFQYVMKNGKPFVNEIFRIQDDPESGKFWFSYIFNGTKLFPFTKSPVDLIPENNDHVVMWYQSGSWIE